MLYYLDSVIVIYAVEGNNWMRPMRSPYFPKPSLGVFDETACVS
jgi:hypothetical protein